MQESLYYEFQIKIHRIYVDINFPCNLQVRWKKGKHQSSGKSFKITESIHYIDTNDSIGIKVRCKIVDNKFVPQETKVQVLLFPLQSNEIKVAGEIQKFDLTQMILIDRRRENTQKKFELPLSKSTPNSRIIFTIYAKFLSDVQHEQSLADMSFQAQNTSNFNHSATDMTFRPPSEGRRASRHKDQPQTRSPLMPPKAEQRPENREERIHSRQNRHDTGRQNRDQNRYDHKKTESRNQTHPFHNVDMPLGFSFGPQMGPQQKERQVKELLQNFNEVNREMIEKKKQCERLQVTLRQTQRQRGGIDQKKLQLINELNSAITQVDSLKKEKIDFNREIAKYKDEVVELKAENKDLINNFNRLRQESSQKTRELNDRNQRKEKQIDDFRSRIQKLTKENEDNKNQLFRKQSQLISIENQAEQIKVTYRNKSVPMMQELKKVNQDLDHQRIQQERQFKEMSHQRVEQERQLKQLSYQRAQQQRQLKDISQQLMHERSLREETEKRARTSIEELQKERQKIKNLVIAFETKEKQNKQSLGAIEQEMQHYFGQKDNEIREKDHQIQELTSKLHEESRRREQESKMAEVMNRDSEGNQIMISQLRVKIKHLEEAYQNLEKDYAEKEKEGNEKAQFIVKVREYVSKLEHENQEKEVAIKERDEFIAKAKEFITTRENELLQQIEVIKKEKTGNANAENQKLIAEISSLMAQGRQREAFVAQLVADGNVLQQKIDETQGHRQQAQIRAGQLQQYAGHLQQKLQMIQQEFQQLVRKTKSQEENLNELIKNKLQMEIQLNLCNFEISNLKKGR